MGTLPAGCEARCRGCGHRDWSARDSEAQKVSFISDRLAPWAPALRPLRAVTETARLGYRERTCLRAQREGDRWAFGMLRTSRDSDPELVAIPDCPVHSARVRGILTELTTLIPGDVPLRFVVISGTLASLVVAAPELPVSLKCTDWSTLAGLGVQGLFANLNPAAGQRVFSARGWRLLWGQATARDTLGLAYGPSSFQQLLPGLYLQALAEARAFLAPQSGDRVLDLCSGNGASLREWQGSGAEFLGVELGGEASHCAEINVGKGACLRGRVSERLPQLAAFAAARSGRLLVFANPPRLGLESEVTSWLGLEARPERIAYLSCSPGTLARELEFLNAQGYGVRDLIPFDFFPQTHHVEVLALLTRESGSPCLGT